MALCVKCRTLPSIFRHPEQASPRDSPPPMLASNVYQTRAPAPWQDYSRFRWKCRCERFGADGVHKLEPVGEVREMKNSPSRPWKKHPYYHDPPNWRPNTQNSHKFGRALGLPRTPYHEYRLVWVMLLSPSTVLIGEIVALT